MIYPADCMGLWEWPKQWLRLLHGSLETDAEPVMVYFCKLLPEGSALF